MVFVGETSLLAFLILIFSFVHWDSFSLCPWGRLSIDPRIAVKSCSKPQCVVQPWERWGAWRGAGGAW